MRLSLDDLRGELPAPAAEQGLNEDASSSSSSSSSSSPLRSISLPLKRPRVSDRDGPQSKKGPAVVPAVESDPIDDGLEFKEEKCEVNDINSELNTWLGDYAPVYRWDDVRASVSVAWTEDEARFPRLSLLARRFLCILPTSASSERVWSGFGRLLNHKSSKMDSDIAAKIMFLRYNGAIVDRVPIF